MKKLLLLALAACLPFSLAIAQGPDPANFHIYYGTTDGSVIATGLDRDLEIPCWGSTSPGPGDLQDSVTFMHNPLASDDLIITARNGGFFPPYFVGLWDDRSFLNPDLNQPIVGYTSQSMLGFAYLTDPRDPQNFFYTMGDIALICTFRMHTTADGQYLNQTVCPFREGHNAANGGLLWGMQDGVRGVVAIQSYSCLFFSPNTSPVWVDYGPFSAFPGMVTFYLRGTDTDPLDDLHIVYTGSQGTFTETVGGPGGVAEGYWTGLLTMIGANIVTGFELSDGVNPPVPLEVTVNIACGDLVNNSVLYINCPIVGFPGANVQVPVNLYNECFVGGFEVLIAADPTALTMNSIVPTMRTFGGAEYFNVNMNANGPGTARVVYIADINNGFDHDPIYAGDGAIFVINFHVTSGLPFGMEIPVIFDFTGPDDYTSNTISDETGYQFIHPRLDDGCVRTYDERDFRGDPNMNCFEFEVADAVLVARRLIEGYIVWSEDDYMPNEQDCNRHYPGNDGAQEAAADLNNNGFADVADLVTFITILNTSPKLDPGTALGAVSISMTGTDNLSVNVNSNVEVGGVLVSINHQGVELGKPVANGMDIQSYDANGVLHVVVYSLAGRSIPAGASTLFTVPVLNDQGTMAFGEVSAADTYGRLLDASAHVGVPVPTAFSVDQNYPNPFNAKTLIKFGLPNASDVTVNIYNVTGQLVETLRGHYDAGFNSITWNASNVASGIYFYKLTAGEFSQTMKMTLLK